MGKIALYANTIRYLKFEQLWYQVWKKAGCKCPLIRGYKPNFDENSIVNIPALEILDFDHEFLCRFSVEELMSNRITLLHSSEQLDLKGSWFFENRSPLWNHNLHYFEYLFSLAKKFKESNEEKYLEKIKEYIICWIENNPEGCKNSAWECYPIALRIPNWIDLYSLLRDEFNEDENFKESFLKSIFNQYVYLLNHLEKHLLANHYFEDLRTLVIASLFFGDNKVFEVALKELIEQCSEQILEDGIHYERSPMYQKILLEDLIRVENSLEFVGKRNDIIRNNIKKMIDVSYSFENGMERLPLFNDCGSNISKSIGALSKACEDLGIKAEFRSEFSVGGYYIFNYGNNNKWRIIIDAGQPGPDYSPGHAHCEMMSFEIFHNGKPYIVNCGTYAYQSNQRCFFKSTEASNTVKVAQTEQSEYWSNFRMARRARLRKVELQECGIQIQMTDFKGHLIQRIIKIHNDNVEVMDESINEEIESFLHFDNDINIAAVEKGDKEYFETPYATEFGTQRQITALRISGKDCVKYSIRIGD